MRARTVPAVLRRTAEAHGDAPALHQPEGGGYRVYTWREYVAAAGEIAAGLRAMGIGPGDIVALASGTRAEFYLADVGIMAAGATSAALYTSYPPADLCRTLKACDAKAVIVEDGRMLASLQAAGASGIPAISLTGAGEGATPVEQLRRRGREALARDAALADASTEAGYAILYLTSGATGEPKIALMTHAAIIANIEMGPPVLDLGPDDVMLAFLPPAHITQRVVLELLPMLAGVPVWFSESLMQLPQELARVSPTLFVAPPRLWERVHKSFQAEMKKRPRPVQAFFRAARAAVLDKFHGTPLSPGRKLLVWAADRVLFSRVRARFGRRLRVAGSGSAPLGQELAEFFASIGLPLVEGYGLTEAGVVTLNPLDHPRAGSIGKALPGIELRLAEDGELLIRSGTLFSGYYNDPTGTARVLAGGWLHTGDLAAIDEEGFVTITGRKKDLIVLSNGRKIYPSRIEALFHLEPAVSNVLLVGDRMPYVTALITVDRALAGDAGVGPEVTAQVQSAVARVNAKLADFERVRRFRVLDRDFSIESGELTATMKVRRARALENFEREVAELYAGG